MWSRGVVSESCNQALMADDSYLSSPIGKYRKPTSSIFGSPKIFLGFSPKAFTNAESLKSPTSILDSRPFFALKNPFSSEKKPPKYDKKSRCDTLDSRKIGLAIIEDSKSPQFGSKMVVFGSKLKIQIPPLPPPVIPPSESPKSPKSPSDFGIKSKNYQFGSRENSNSTRIFTGFLSANAMELSEDYTRVISHGPIPRTTHIFDNCIIENCSGGFGFSGNKSMMSFPSESFLSCCYACKKKLGEGIDIYMYRGEKAFCSSECRYKEMMLEEKLGESDYD